MFVGHFTDFTTDIGSWRRLSTNIIGVYNSEVFINVHNWETADTLGIAQIKSNGEIIHKTTDGRSVIKRYFYGKIYGR